MADTISTKRITDLPEDTDVNDNDLFMAGSNGTASLRKKKWSTLLTKIKSVLLANNLTTTTAGYALDARQGKALKDQLDQQNTKNIFNSWTCNYNLLTYAQDIGAGHFAVFNYNGYSADGPINAAPTNAHGMGIACNRDGDYIILVVFPFENSSALGQAFIRTKQGGNWGGWNQIK